VLQPKVIGVTVATIATASALFSRRIGKESKSATSSENWGLEILLPSALIAISVTTGGRFDYASYKLQWQAISDSLNPWGPIPGGMANAYGPVHNMFFAPYSVWHLLPKIIFCVLVMAIYQVYKRRWSESMNRKALLMICYGPFIFSSIGVFGFNDILPAALICFAATAFDGRRYRQAGTFLALGTAVKFYPALLFAPVFSALLKRNDLKACRSLTLSFALTLVVVFGCAWFIWGEAVLTPLRFASERGPSFLTAWRLLPHEWAAHAKTLIACSIGILSIFTIKTKGDRNINIGHLLLSGLCLIFSLYYLGHQQFYTAIYLMLPAALMECSEGRVQRVPISMIANSLLLFWLTFTQTSFDLFAEFKPTAFVELVDQMSVFNSLLLFVCGCLYASQIIRLESKTEGKALSVRDSEEAA